jgi:hypothetical protein
MTIGNQGRLVMDKLWYYTQGAAQEKKGPVPEADIKSLVAAGQIHATDLLWSDGMANWAPLSALPQLQAEHTTTLPSPAAAAAEVFFHQSPLPEGLTGWMTFMGVMTIIAGVFQCLNCVGIILGIPTILAGTALLAAKNSIATVTNVDSSLNVFFNKLMTFMKLSGIVYIAAFILVIVLCILYFGVIAAAIAGKGGLHP